ncbi:hypothetical protein GCM10020000_17960 [Streptomyces olivoverticillatus]
MRAYLVALQPRGAQLLQGVLDVRVGGEVDGRLARLVAGPLVLLPLGLRQQVDAAEEVRHLRVVLLGQGAEAGEEMVVVLQRAVPGEDDELRRLLARLELLGLGHLGLGGPV